MINVQKTPPWHPKSITRMRGDWPVVEEFFYIDPTTGEYVYKWADERLILVDSEALASYLDNRPPE